MPAAPESIFEPDEARLELELDMLTEELDSDPMRLAKLSSLKSQPLDLPTLIDDAGSFEVLESIHHHPTF